MTRIKICGITQKKDAAIAVALGADALGFIFVKSPRQVSLFQARHICAGLPPFVSKVGVFVNASKENVLKTIQYCGLDTVQLHGNESDKYCAFLKKYCKIIKAFRISDKASLKPINTYKSPDAFLFDTYVLDSPGGTGKTFAHKLLKNLKFSRPIIISGGLNSANVLKVIKLLKPYAVDVSSGVENKPGEKDIKKLKAFIAAVKN
jgi:phosphoribosylanthranilate isomerase